mgnify:CR=1 FL=1
MELEIDIRVHLKSAFKSGFKIVESKDLGMAKYCRLQYPILNLEVWNDRFDYNANLEYDEDKFNIIHLANFINDKRTKYIFFDFDFKTRNTDAERFLTQLDDIIKTEFDNILHFLFNLTNDKKNEFYKYCEKRNLELRGW